MNSLFFRFFMATRENFLLVFLLFFYEKSIHVRNKHFADKQKFRYYLIESISNRHHEYRNESNYERI